MRQEVAGLLLSAVHVLALAQALPALAADDDAQRIPRAVLEDEPQDAEAPARSTSVFLEANAEQVQRRMLAVPIASADRRREVLRLLADGRGDWRLGEGLTAKASARLGVAEIRDSGSRRDERFDLREAALQRWLNDRDVVEAGRVNLRQGVALGFNPTDYFKARTTVDFSTRDPQVQRVNRLGTVMLDAQHVGTDGSLLVALAPKLASPTSLADDEPQGLRLGDTNGETRLLIKGQVRIAPWLRPELLAFKDAEGWRFGANLTQAFGQQVIGFVEYSGGRRKPDLQRALENGVALGDLPATAMDAIQASGDEHWQNDLAIGATWTGTNRLSLTLEFDYHEAGFTQQDWQRWFALGASGPDGARLAWYLRGAAGAQQDPLLRHNLFLRAQWDQACLRDLSLNAFVNHSLDDGSRLGQVALEYRINQASRLRAMTLFTMGSSDSYYGSDPAHYAVLIGYVHYLGL